MGGQWSSHKTLEKRFWRDVIKSDSCWNWVGTIKRSTGYGELYTGNYKNTSAHRVAWELLVGKIPEGLCVLHQCDNRLCVRPDHLFLGTQLDNVRDMDRKGRGRRRGRLGESCNLAKLKSEQVIEIRKSYRPRLVTRPMLASQFGVSIAAIKAVLDGRNWKHLL